MGEFLKGPVGSALRVAAGSILGSVVTYLTANGTKASALANIEFWNVALGLAITVAVPLVIAWLNPADDRFGKGS